MVSAPSLIRYISDTALWAAAFRAQETERSDALFRDPFAARLAGSRGFELAAKLSTPANSTSWVTRTWLFDRFISQEITRKPDLVLNLGAGLDTRPYRMTLPASLRWVEVDAPEILAYKEDLLASEKPSCSLERIGLDLLDRKERCALLTALQERAESILIVSEGLLIYLQPEEVAALAADLARHSHFERWILEAVSPQVLERMRLTAGPALHQSGSAFLFGPAEGPDFFARYGWSVVDVRGVLKTAVELSRTPIDRKFLHLIPDSPTDALPWMGVCLLRPQELL